MPSTARAVPAAPPARARAASGAVTATPQSDPFTNVDPELLKNPKVQAQLRAFLEAKRANPLQGYFPHAKQRPFHRAALDVKLFVGGNRSGKSTAGVVDDLIQAVDSEFLPDHLKSYKKWEPPFFCRVVTPDFAKTLQAVTEVIRKWCPKAQMLGGSWEKAWSQQEKVFRLANGSFIECMTYEQDLDKFGGTARHRIHYDEEPDGDKGEQIREECVTRLIDFNGDEVFTFTPLSGLSWIFDGLWEERGKEVEPKVWISESMIAVQADMDDNPSLNEDGKAKALAAYPEKVREARKRGDFTHFKGLVYEEFDYARHVAKERPSPHHVKSLDTLVAIDPGIRTTAVSFLGFDNDNIALLYDELYLHDDAAIPENASKFIRAKLKMWHTTADWYYIDPSARNRNLITGENVESAYMRAGIPTIPGQNEVEAGIFEVKRRLESNPPGLVVSPDCEKWLWECRRYRYDDREDGSFAVLKRDDHLLDATRYGCMARTWYAPPPSHTPLSQPSYRPDYQPPYKTERAPLESPPEGASY